MRGPASRGKTGTNAVTADIIYVFRSQLHSKHSSGNKYGSMRNTSETSFKGAKI